MDVLTQITIRFYVWHGFLRLSFGRDTAQVLREWADHLQDVAHAEGATCDDAFLDRQATYDNLSAFAHNRRIH